MREAIETQRKTLDSWKINGPVADLFSFQHCMRCHIGLSRARIASQRMSLFLSKFVTHCTRTSNMLRSLILLFFFLCFFTSHCYAVTHCRGPWIPGPLKFLSPADSPLSSRINISDATVKPCRPLEFYRKIVNLFILNHLRTSENVKMRRIDVRKRTKIIRMAYNKNSLGHFFSRRTKE